MSNTTPQDTLGLASAHAAALIADWEKFAPVAYHGAADRAGIWTLGFGQITWNGKPVTQGMTCTREQALAGLQSIVGLILPKFIPLAPSGATPWQIAAVSSLAYNVGSNAVLASTLVRKWTAGDIQGAADQFPVWCHSAGQVVLGLQLRRSAERALFLFA